MHLDSREDEFRHTATVCGWYSGDWVPMGRARVRHHVEPDLQGAVALVYNVSPNPGGLLDCVVAQARQKFAPVLWFAGSDEATDVEEAVDAFVSRVRSVEGVENVFFQERDGQVRVWTIMDERDRDVEDRVYGAEEQTLSEHRNLLFRFGILYRHGSPLESLRPAEARVAF
jgi:hypothetical protein